MTFEEAVKLMQKRKVVARRNTSASARNMGYTLLDKDFVWCGAKGYGAVVVINAEQAMADDWEVVDCTPPAKFINGWHDVADVPPPLNTLIQTFSESGSWYPCVTRRTEGWYSWELGGYDQCTWVKIVTPAAWTERPTMESITCV